MSDGSDLYLFSCILILDGGVAVVPISGSPTDSASSGRRHARHFLWALLVGILPSTDIYIYSSRVFPPALFIQAFVPFPSVWTISMQIY